MRDYAGIFPKDANKLVALPGIGLSTANAILSLAYQQPTAICDGNVRRVLARWLAIDLPIESSEAKALFWQQAQRLQSHAYPRSYTQAIMDLGATLCTRTNPRCHECPLTFDCQARLSGKAVTQWPVRQKKAGKPIRECIMFMLIREDGAVWLEAPKQQEGLWGGLYQLPQILPIESAKAIAINLPKIKHVFTHFTLWITPSVINVSNLDLTRLPINGVWYNLDHNVYSVARPAIVDKLIRYWQTQGNKA
jgi:A/G-specific adenine glycosylase